LKENGHDIVILVVGQTPPPFGGQAVMIQLLLDGRYEGVQLRHVKLESSRDLGSMGKWQFAKLWRLMQVVANIYYAKLRWQPDALYYPPCGPGLLPVARDIAVLATTRYLFHSTIFHFHASGLTEYSKRLNPIVKMLFDFAYGRPDIAIRLSKSAPAEGPNLDCREEYIIANGIPDAAGTAIERTQTFGCPLQILFVALMSADKGVLVAIEAVSILLQRGANVQLTCVGGWESATVRNLAETLIDPSHKVHFAFPGVLVGEEKWDQYRAADIFCFPSFFHAETFPLVLLEAMSFSLPIVSTHWRGIPDVVEENVNAVLADPRNVSSCVQGLSTLIDDSSLRTRMGQASRKRFLEHFTIEKHREAMGVAFHSLRGEYVTL
jgi:glycosyltransferase involved in cell wall biosynthesis